jgi:two-component system catabolic regulation response regulator CreB
VSRVLVVDDEPAIRDAVEYALRTEGFEVDGAADGEAGLRAALEGSFDIVVLDLMLPRMAGTEVCRRLRAESSVPIIMLTAKGTELDRVLGLEIGADDYVVKPFSPRELAARVKAVLRRTQAVEVAPQNGNADASKTTPGLVAPPPSAAGVLAVNPSKRQVTYHGVQLTLSKYEYEILTVFVERPGHVFSRDQLMSRVWEVPEASLERTVDAHIKNLRAKLRAVRPEVDPIITHRGTGYSLREDL